MTKKPNSIFIIDGFGALLTALILFIVFNFYNEYFGLTKKILVVLAGIASVFFFIHFFAMFLLILGVFILK